MAVKGNKRRFVLSLLGWVCLFGTLGKAYVDREINYVYLSLIFIGVLCFIVYFIDLRKQNSPSKKNNNSRKIVFIVFLILNSFLFYAGINFTAYKFNIRWDLTKYKQHTLAKNTVNLLKNLKSEVKISVLHVGLAPKYLEDLLQEYEHVSNNKIKTEIIDPIMQIGYAAQFGNIIQGKERKAVVQSGNERADVDFSNTPLTEDLINNAVKSVTRKARTVYFLTGHGEYQLFNQDDQGLSKFVKYMMGYNYLAKELVLAANPMIPDDCDLLIIAGPKESLSAGEETIIKNYLKSGGDALFLIEHTVVTSPDKPLSEEELDKNPSLNSLLNEWGLNVNPDIVVDLASHASGDVGSPATRNYMAHQDIIKNIDYTFYIRPRSISLKSDRRKSIKAVPFILTQSKEQSWGETNRTLDVKFDPGIDREGPVPIGFVVFEPTPGENDQSREVNKGTRMIVVTDADFLTNVYIDHYSNAEMGLRIINWLTQLDYEVYLEKEAGQIEKFDLTSQQKKMIVVVLVFLPVFILFLAFRARAKQYF